MALSVSLASRLLPSIVLVNASAPEPQLTPTTARKCRLLHLLPRSPSNQRESQLLTAPGNPKSPPMSSPVPPSDSAVPPSIPSAASSGSSLAPLNQGIYLYFCNFSWIYLYFDQRGTVWCMHRRAVLVREPDRPEGEPVDITPKDYAVRTLAQEYGGGAFSVSGDTLIFSNYKDQRLYKQSLSPNGI